MGIGELAISVNLSLDIAGRRRIVGTFGVTDKTAFLAQYGVFLNVKAT